MHWNQVFLCVKMASLSCWLWYCCDRLWSLHRGYWRFFWLYRHLIPIKSIVQSKKLKNQSTKCHRKSQSCASIHMCHPVFTTGSSIYICPPFEDSPFLAQSTQESVIYLFRKLWVVAINNSYEIGSKSVMEGSRWVLVKVLGLYFLHWTLKNHHS